MLLGALSPAVLRSLPCRGVLFHAKQANYTVMLRWCRTSTTPLPRLLICVREWISMRISEWVRDWKRAARWERKKEKQEEASGEADSLQEGRKKNNLWRNEKSEKQMEREVREQITAQTVHSNLLCFLFFFARWNWNCVFRREEAGENFQISPIWLTSPSTICCCLNLKTRWFPLLEI